MENLPKIYREQNWLIEEYNKFIRYGLKHNENYCHFYLYEEPRTLYFEIWPPTKGTITRISKNWTVFSLMASESRDNIDTSWRKNLRTVKYFDEKFIQWGEGNLKILNGTLQFLLQIRIVHKKVRKFYLKRFFFIHDKWLCNRKSKFHSDPEKKLKSV